jgi:AraC-like DNA-binding protein
VRGIGLVARGSARRAVVGVEEPAEGAAATVASLVPDGPFAGLEPRFSEETKVLFVVDGPKAVAARRNVSLRTLFRRFRERGSTAGRVRQACRADVAAGLLRAGFPIVHVARCVGLSGPQALRRVVRSTFGLTPKELRSERARDGEPGS